MFVNRINEIKALEKFYLSGETEFVIVYGRRRIGKTELLKQFARDRKHFFFSSDMSSEQEQLRQFTEKIYSLTGESFLRDYSFSNWEHLLNYLFDHVVPEFRLIIIDEFPYLCMSNMALPSILQKIWDENGKDSGIFLILCGSYINFMEKELLKHKVLKELFPGYTQAGRLLCLKLNSISLKFNLPCFFMLYFVTILVNFTKIKPKFNPSHKTIKGFKNNCRINYYGRNR
ncbi:MAG: ATP-binding protein [Candidatus Eremiobacterota bacterium]